jgi:RNA polymerase sigma factor (sigma-70 family)
MAGDPSSTLVGTTDIHALVRSCSKGDRKAESEVFTILYKFVRVTLERRWLQTFGSEEVEDLLLQCMEKLLTVCRDPQRAETAIENGRFFGYVHSLAEHAALDHYRAKKRRSKVFLSISDKDSDGESTNALENLPSGEAELTDLILSGVSSRRALRKIDVKQRRVIEMRLNGAEYAEISTELAISEANARQIHKRGVRALREVLISENEEILFSLRPSHAAFLRRQYLRSPEKGIGPHRAKDLKAPGGRSLPDEASVGEEPVSEEDALQEFYTVLVEQGLFIWAGILIVATIV